MLLFWEKYLSNLKQHGLPVTYWVKNSCLNVYQSWSMGSLFPLLSYLIMLSWQLILLHNFHNMRVTWLFYHFFKLQVHILHSLVNIWIFDIWKLWLVRCDIISVERASYYRRCPKRSEVKRFPFGDSLTQLSRTNSRTAWPIPAIYILFSSILNALSYEINLFSRCNSPLSTYWSSNFLPKTGKSLTARQKWTPRNA